MTRIVFETAEGSIPVDSDEDISVMEVAKDNGIAGIDADCGEMVCGTCHVFVDEADLRNFPASDDMEEMILENILDPGGLPPELIAFRWANARPEEPFGPRRTYLSVIKQH